MNCGHAQADRWLRAPTDLGQLTEDVPECTPRLIGSYELRLTSGSTTGELVKERD